MENHIETNFREIQKILDSCIAHDYKTKVDALFLKREYLTQAQLKDYLGNVLRLNGQKRLPMPPPIITQ